MKSFLLTFFAAMALLCLRASAADLPPRYPELPPVWSYDRADKATDAPARFRAIGPVFEKRFFDDPKLSYSAFRPLWSRQDSPDGMWNMDFIWPLSVWRDSWHVDYQWVLLYFGSTDSDGRYRQYIIPIWFCGRDADKKFYWGLFPLYGDVKDLISYDQTTFIAWPLYWHTEKNGTKGEAYVWPLVNMESGPRSDKFRAFPFYAYNDVYARHYTQSFLWPIVETTKSQSETTPGQGWMFWPFYGRNTFDDKTTWSVLWPLITHAKRGDNAGVRTHAPWPIVRYSRDYEREGERMLWIWPFWGRRLKADENSQFFVFPLGWYLEDRGEQRNSRWYWALPVYWTQVVYDKGRTKRELLYRRFWPVASYYEEGDGASLRILDIWPVRRTEPIERNWSALWTLYSYDETAKGYSWDCLWGMLRGSKTYADNGGRFAFAPFYDVSWSDSQSIVCEGGRDVRAVSRDYLFGAVRVYSAGREIEPKGAVACRLFWCWNLEF